MTIPILPSADFDASAAFWGRFGFAEADRWADEYLVLRSQDLGVELHFWYDDDVDRWTNDVACYVRFDSPEEARACHAGWAGVPLEEPARMSEPEEEPWGAVEFHIIDPYGNLVRLGGFPSTQPPSH